jgi:hypothetical protein
MAAAGHELAFATVVRQGGNQKVIFHAKHIQNRRRDGLVGDLGTRLWLLRPLQCPVQSVQGGRRKQGLLHEESRSFGVKPGPMKQIGSRSLEARMMRRTARLAICLLSLGWTLATAGESGLGQRALPSPMVQLPDCSVRTACLCPWRGLLSLDDFVPIDPSRVPGQVLAYESQELCEWHVVLTTTGPKVFHTREDYRRDTDKLQVRTDAKKRPWDDRGRRLVVAISDGHVVARDAGEWGADVWWVSKDGRSSVQLGEQHVTDLVATPHGVIATVYSESMRLPAKNQGEVLRIDRSPNGRWQLSRLTETEKPALSATLRANGDVLVATGNRLLRIGPDGTSRMLHAGRWSEPLKLHSPIEATGSFSPNSILPLANGDILIGMDAVIVRLTPSPLGYAETWYVPRNGPPS